MDLMKIATQLLVSKFSGAQSGLTETVVSAALSKLMPTSGSGGLDIGSLLGQLNGGGLASLASSWLGDGANSAISSNQIMDLFGQSKVKSFADEIGIDEATASNGLSEVIPDLIDKSSQGGSLLDALGGGNMESLAKNALGSFFK